MYVDDWDSFVEEAYMHSQAITGYSDSGTYTEQQLDDMVAEQTAEEQQSIYFI